MTTERFHFAIEDSLRLEELVRPPRELSPQSILFEMPSAPSVLAIDSLESLTVPISDRMASMVSGITDGLIVDHVGAEESRCLGRAACRPHRHFIQVVVRSPAISHELFDRVSAARPSLVSINAIRDDVRKAPETLAHLHDWSVQLTRRAGQDEVRGALGETEQVAG